MPDSSGWPTEAEIIKRLEVVSPDVVGADVLGQVGSILQGVIADFQAPQSRNGGGGTGRLFTPTVETRLYDGHGYPRLHLGADIVPGTSLTVTIYGSATPLTDVVLVEAKRGLGYNTLVRQTSGSYSLGFYSTGFPQGIQNVSVTATWGFSATVPYDVNQAIMSETLYRIITSFMIDFAGVGVEVQIGNNKVNTAAGISAFAISSPVAVMHNQYLETVARYRTSEAWKLKTVFQQRMS